MATLLTKAIKRELVLDQRGKTVMIELEPGDLISFRLKGKRTRYTVSLHKCFNLAMLQFLNDDYQDRLKKHEIKKKAGYKTKKPKQPGFSMYDQFMLKVFSTKI